MSTTGDYSAKSNAELKQFRENAERILADPKRAAQHARARAMLEALPAPALSAFARKRAEDHVSTLTEAAIARLTALATEVRTEFDLAPPEGTRQPHKLTSADGTPKVGGRQRNREVAVDRYLSYKRGDRLARIGWVRRFDEDAVTGGHWYVSQRDAAGEDLLLDDAEEAVATFREALAEVAPAKG